MPSVQISNCFITGFDLKSFTEAKPVIKQLEIWTDGIHLFYIILFLQFIGGGYFSFDIYIYI